MPDILSHEDSDPRFSEEIYKAEEFIYEGDEYHFPKATKVSTIFSNVPLSHKLLIILI